jgi:broad specificity phosphatase PhoE
MLLYLVRHGETVYNAEGRIQGQSDAPLSALGQRQSAAVADALAALSIEALYCSPLRRARQTAEPIAARLKLPVHDDRRLMELDAGQFTGRLRSELADVYPEQLARWLSGDEDFAIPDGESRRQLAERGSAALRDIAATGHDQVVVITHGGLLSATLGTLLQLGEPMPPFAFQNGSITRVAADGQGQFTLIAFNEIDHLRDVGPSRGGDL